MLTIPAGRRAAVVAGVRTPFAKSGTVLKDVTAVTLARYAARELLARTDLAGSEVDEVIFGQVIPSVLVPNLAREVSLLPQFPKTIPAYTPEPRLRLRRPGHRQRRRPDHARPGRRGRGRRGRIALGHPDPPFAPLQRAAGRGQQGAESRPAARHSRQAAPARPRPGHAGHRRAVHRRVHGAVRREDGEGERHPPRGAGPHRAAEPPAGRGRDRRRPAAGGDRAVVRRPRHGRGAHQRQRRPRRHLARGARQAEAGVRPALRLGHGRQRLAAHRRRRRGADDDRRKGAGARLPAARHRAELRRGRRRSRLAAPDGPGLRGAEGARARRHRLERPRARRDARGLRGAGALEHPGLGLEGVGRAPRARGAGGRGRTGTSRT